MIVRMSKVEIIGTKDLLQDVLSLLRERGIFQIEPATIGFVEDGQKKFVRSFLPDEKTAYERIFLEKLRLKIDGLFSLLPQTPKRKSSIEPRPIIDTIAKTIDQHTIYVKGLKEKRDTLQKEWTDLDHYTRLLGSFSSLVASTQQTPDLDFIGIAIQNPELTDHLREAISRITDWKFDLQTKTVEDGTLVGLITVERNISDKVKKSLSDEHVHELIFPPSFSGLTFRDKVAYAVKRSAEVSRELQDMDSKLLLFSQRWVPIYQRAKEWIEDRLALLQNTTSAFETRMSFVINGWMPSEDLERLSYDLMSTFRGKVVVEEKVIRENDLERVPIILKNPSYFKPFEIFSRILPLPAYSSYDPTPFIGIFFPIFFGMILGDAGYGLLLGIISLIVWKRHKQQGAIHDGAEVLLVASCYSVLFGVLFGEFFGDLPQRLFGLEPLWMERRNAVIPMLLFALVVGVAHIILGLLLGAIAAFKRKISKEAVNKLLDIIIILFLIIVIGSFFGYFPALLTRPIILVILLLAPLLLFAGGILAPLEVLQSIGNIVSYVRIMAIGLASVLLASVANRLAGLTGNIILGVVVAVLLHLINVVLGVFSPTIHSLRLHYVEFFSRFMEFGGRKFAPLKK